MYTLAKGPTTSIFQRTRRDVSLKLENLELRRKNSASSDDSDKIIMSSPRPTFQSSVHSKGGRNSNGRHASNNSHQDTSPPLSPSHLEIVNYLTTSWANVQHEIELQKAADNRQPQERRRIRVHKETEVHPLMKDFKPFELDNWWATRLYTKLTAS